MWSSSVSDDALLAGLAAGDRTAATAFVRRFQARVYGLALAIVRDPGVAEDVAQEAFLRAWRHAAAYDPRRGSVPTWLLTIARNLAIDATRLRRAEPVDPEALLALGLVSPDADPGEREVQVDETERLRRAVRTCRPSSAARSCSPASTGTRPGRSASSRTCRSARPRRGSGRRCCGCGPRWG